MKWLLREDPWNHYLNRLPKNFTFWNGLFSSKEREKLVRNPNFYNFWAKPSSTLPIQKFWTKISVRQNPWIFVHFGFWSFSSQKLDQKRYHIIPIDRAEAALQNCIFYVSLYEPKKNENSWKLVQSIIFLLCFYMMFFTILFLLCGYFLKCLK
jgi:hypothetical protein